MYITWKGNIERNNKAEIERILRDWLWIVPRWLLSLIINVEPSDNKDLLASTCVNEKYREANITFRPLWFTETERCKTDTLIHELLHLHTNPLYDFADFSIRQYADGVDEKQLKIVQKELNSYLERQTQDLAFAILENSGSFNSELISECKRVLSAITQGRSVEIEYAEELLKRFKQCH